MKFNIIPFILLMIICSFLFIGQEIREEEGPDYDIKNNTANLQWNFTYNETNMTTLEQIIYKWADTFGFTALEVSKWGIEYGFEHPEIGFEQYFDFVRTILIIIVLLMLIPVSPYILGFSYLIILGIIKGLKKLLLKVK